MGDLELVSDPVAAGFGAPVNGHEGCLFFQILDTDMPTHYFFRYCPVGQGKDAENDLVPGTDIERLTWFDGRQAIELVRL